MSQELDISVVVPVYNEEESLPELSEWIDRVMTEHKFTYEVLYIDDGSSDASWEVIEGINQRLPAFKGIRLNSNNGKSAALDIGFKEASGNVVITMDADLQDSPDEVPELYRMIMEDGFDIVSGWKKKRHDPLSKTIPTKLYNAVTRSMSGIKLHDFNCGLKAYKKIVIKNVDVYGEMHRYIPVMAKFKGFKKIGEKVVVHRPRKYGVTKFGYERFIFGFLDLLSITFVTRFKRRPMHFFGSLGILSFLVGLVATFWVLLQKQIQIAQGERFRDVVDNPIFFLALIAIIIGVQLFLAGFLGEMIHLSQNGRQEYLIRKKVGF